MFNESQWQAISHEKGPGMVLAGPGTGKTTVITERIKRLIEERVALPEEILVVTFTKAAAMEMKGRFHSLIGVVRGDEVTFGTFHSIFFQIIKKSNAGLNNIRVLSEADRYRIFREIIMRLGVENTNLQEFIQKMAFQISKYKEYKAFAESDGGKKLCSGCDGEKEMDGIKTFGSYFEVCDEGTFYAIYKEYERALKVENKIDFDDMVSRCYVLLKNNPQVLKFWQDRFKFILVDEFQDVNQSQFEIVKLLAGKRRNIFVVGDDDQSIYGFRGAGPNIMFDFKKEYREAAVINLNVNYRCTTQIMEVASNLISCNEMRYEKNNISFKGEGKEVDVREFKNNIQQYEYMVNAIKRYLDKGMKPEDIAILVRNNESVPLIRNYLGDRRVCSRTGRKDNIYNHPVAKDVISYIKAANSDLNKPLLENKELLSILNKPERYIGRQVISDGMSIRELLEVYKGCSEIRKNIKELINHLTMIKKLTPYGAVNYIKYGVGYDRYMKKHSAETKTRYEELSRILEFVQRNASGYKNTSMWLEAVENSFMQGNKDDDGRGVSIITMHASKGLEFSVVFIPDVNQGVIPGARAVREYELEEERRVFYVALTRSSQYLHVLIPRQVMGRKYNPSQFVNEMCTCLHF